jgi:hypothetical protein
LPAGFPSSIGRNSKTIVPHLTHLNLTHAKPTMDLFNSVEFPSLTTLQLSTIADGRTLAVIMEMCSPTLRHLKISVWCVSAEELVQMLGYTNQLESLEIVYCRIPRELLITDALLMALTPHQSWSSSSECLCPQLQDVVLHASNLSHIRDDVTFEFIKARRTMRNRMLRNVYIQLLSVAQEDEKGTSTVVERLQQDGVDLGGMFIDLKYKNGRCYFVSR